MAWTPADTRGPTPPRRGLGLAVGVALAAGLAVVDWRLGPEHIVTVTVLLGPIACSLLATGREVVVVGVLATALAVASPLWNDNHGDVAYFLRTAVVAVGSAVSVLTAVRSEVIRRERQRFAVLSGAADVGTGTLTLEETAERLVGLLVPAIADTAVIDVVERDELRRLAVGVNGDSEAERVLARQRRGDATAYGARGVMATRAPRLVPRVDDAILRQVARDEADVAQLRAVGFRSSIVVPLVARGRALGALTVCTTIASGRTFTASDAGFLEVLSGRAALALDNAGLFAELGSMEAQLSAAMSGLAEAVTIQRPDGALVYANEAAARMLGFPSGRDLVTTPVERVVSAFESVREDGSPLRVEDLPGRRVLAGETAEPLVVRAVDRATGEERWRVTKATPVLDRHDRVQLVVNVIEDITEVKRAELAQRLLARAGEVLASSLDRDATLQRVAELAVPDLADWCSVTLPDGRGRLRAVAVAHRDPARVALARQVIDRYPAPEDSETGAAQVMRTGRLQIVPEVTEEMLRAAAQDEDHAELLLRLGMRSALLVPMVAGGRPIGTLTLVNAESGRAFTPDAVDLAGEVARRAGVAVENARLYTERSEIARTLQRALLPQALPDMPGWAATPLYRPAGEENWVGGDFYDVVAVDGGWFVVVGDVAGRGADAAGLTGVARSTLRTAARLLADPFDAVAQLNDELVARPGLALCTVGAARLAERDGAATAEVLCAGHPPPVVVDGDRVTPIEAFGPMLGAFPSETWPRATVELRPGALLVLYTDGVLDTVGAGGERFGEARLHAALAGATSDADAVARVQAALRAFEVGPQADDTALLALQRAGAPALSRPTARRAGPGTVDGP